MGTRAVTLLGGSKTESLTGYRVGAVVASAEIIDAVEQVVAFSALRAPAYSQHVLTGWLRDDEDFVRERVRQLRLLQLPRDGAAARRPWYLGRAGSGHRVPVAGCFRAGSDVLGCGAAFLRSRCRREPWIPVRPVRKDEIPNVLRAGRSPAGCGTRPHHCCACRRRQSACQLSEGAVVVKQIDDRVVFLTGQRFNVFQMSEAMRSAVA